MLGCSGTNENESGIVLAAPDTKIKSQLTNSKKMLTL